jgi:DNA-binding CsgD family transcriptional regulator
MLEEFGEKSQELIESIEALSVLMKNIEIAKQEMGKMIATQIRALLVPIIDSLQDDKNATLLTAQLVALSNYVDNLSEDLPTSQPAQPSLSALSFREWQIALMIKNYLTNEAIAAQLHISPETVRTHRRNIRKKLGIRGNKARLHGHLLALLGNAPATDLSGLTAPGNGSPRHMLCPTERLSLIQALEVAG